MWLEGIIVKTIKEVLVVFKPTKSSSFGMIVDFLVSTGGFLFIFDIMLLTLSSPLLFDLPKLW